MPSMTRAELTTRVSLLIGDTSYQRFTEAQIQDEIQKWQEQFVLDTKCLIDVDLDSIVAGTRSYDLPTDILDTVRVAVNGVKMERTSEYELDVLNNQDWSAYTGTPAKYYVDLDPNNKKLIFDRIPESGDAGTDNLVHEYIKLPPALSSDSSVPLDSHTLLAAYHDAIAYGAAASLLNIQPDQSALVMISQYEKKYSKHVDHCIENFKNLGNQSPINIYRGRNPSNIGR